MTFVEKKAKLLDIAKKVASDIEGLYKIIGTDNVVWIENKHGIKFELFFDDTEDTKDKFGIRYNGSGKFRNHWNNIESRISVCTKYFDIDMPSEEICNISTKLIKTIAGVKSKLSSGMVEAQKSYRVVKYKGAFRYIRNLNPNDVDKTIKVIHGRTGIPMDKMKISFVPKDLKNNIWGQMLVLYLEKNPQWRIKSDVVLNNKDGDVWIWSTLLNQNFPFHIQMRSINATKLDAGIHLMMLKKIESDM